jgi:hypothetical protein
MKSCDSSVGIALGYGLNDRGSRVRFPEGVGNFSHYRVQNGSGVHPASYPIGTRGSFPCGKAAGVWNYHLPPSSTEVKECVELYLHPHYAFTAWRLVKHRDNFTFSILLYMKWVACDFKDTAPQFLFYSATGWTTGFRFLVGALKGFFSSPPRPDRLWGPSSPLATFSRGKAAAEWS